MALALGLAFAVSAQAETDPWYIGATLGFQNDSNVFKTRTNEQSDTTVSAGVIGGLDIPFGRQRAYARLSAEHNKHDNFKELDNTSYSLSSGLDLQTVERLSGALRYSTRRGLTDFGLVEGGQANVERSQQASASARWGLTPRLGLEGGAERRELTYSVTSDRNFTQDSASLGLRWGTPGLLTIGLGARATKGDFPRILISPGVEAVPPLPSLPAVFGPDETDRRDIDLTVTWSPSGLSTFTGRLSATKEEHSEPTFPDFSSWTGAASWDYRPTARLGLKATMSRDTGSNTVFIESPLPGLLPATRQDYTRISTLFMASASYELTAKITLNLSGSRLSGDTVNPSSGTSFSSSTTRLQLAASYVPTRSVTVGCNVGQNKRENVYTANTVGCSASLTLR